MQFVTEAPVHSSCSESSEDNSGSESDPDPDSNSDTNDPVDSSGSDGADSDGDSEDAHDKRERCGHEEHHHLNVSGCWENVSGGNPIKFGTMIAKTESAAGAFATTVV